MTAQVMAKTLDISKNEWLELRRKGIGGSDAAAIIGLDRYRSAFDVYAEKVGLKIEEPDNEAMRQGRDLEDYVSLSFRATGKKVRKKCYAQHRTLLDVSQYRPLGSRENAGFEAKPSVLNRTKFAQANTRKHYISVCTMAVTGLIDGTWLC